MRKPVFLLVAILVILAAKPAYLAAKILPKIASINMCLDQYLLDLARPEQIAGLSPFARDKVRSWAHEKTAPYRILSGTAEEIIEIKPDLVVAGTFTRKATRDFVAAKKIPMQVFDLVRNIAEAKAQISHFGRLTDNIAKADQRNAEIDAAVTRLRNAARHGLRVLPVGRRGWVSGRETLVSNLLSVAGLTNAAGETGLKGSGTVPLETIVKLKPDAILVSRSDNQAEDQGRAVLLHPAIADLFPPERRIVIPEYLTVCSGPMLAEAIDHLAGQIEKLKPRDAVSH